MAEEAKKVEESKELKFTDEELESLQGLQTGYQEKVIIDIIEIIKQNASKIINIRLSWKTFFLIDSLNDTDIIQINGIKIKIYLISSIPLKYR